MSLVPVRGESQQSHVQRSFKMYPLSHFAWGHFRGPKNKGIKATTEHVGCLPKLFCFRLSLLREHRVFANLRGQNPSLVSVRGSKQPACRIHWEITRFTGKLRLPPDNRPTQSFPTGKFHRAMLPFHREMYRFTGKCTFHREINSTGDFPQ